MTLAFVFIVIHYIADFIFQDEKWAINKSKSNKALVSHTITYTLVFFVVFALWCAYQNHIGHLTPKDMGWTPKIFLFFPISFILHTITDYFTSRIVSKKFVNKQFGSPIPNFGAFSIIGLDQVIHYGTLFLTYYFVTH